jgi:serine phosphatase RsbU (regulator of sigma subunit)/biotin operon repressor
MRADRLLSALLLLQAHGRLTGRELARRLEVSERTVHRDMEALSASGVPVYALRGAQGGWQLDEGWRTQVPGLDEVELRALLMAQTRVIGDAWLSAAAERALGKLMAALPQSLREQATSIRQRLYVDATTWRGTIENLSMLPTVQDAVSRDRKLLIKYWKAGRELVERTVDPLGLVAKGNTWYLFARTTSGFRTYRISRINEATLLDEPSERPPDFDLASYWKNSTAQFHDEVSREIEARSRAIAEKMEAERRVLQELEIAKQVQARLFPQTLPPMRTLDYAGVCIQARQVGGDYYDFLDLGQDRLGLAIGDIAGKGIAAALLMANLQANLRSQCAIALDQPQRLLRSVNQLFFKNTIETAYATLFFAEYDDRVRRLRYANCGHLSALLLRGNDTLERLGSTGTPVGLFEEWDCTIGERQLFTGDTLALYTDGITEAFNDTEEEFGERRLIEALRRNRGLDSAALMSTVVDEVQKFCPYSQRDDITLIVARCKGS